MARPSANPLDGVDRLLVDGNNLLGAIRARGGHLPAPALVGRLRGAIRPDVSIELVFDGPPNPGMSGVRVASDLIVRYGGRRSADELLLALVDEARAAAGPAGADNILVVSDDRALRLALRDRSARTAGTHWLIGRLERTTLAGPATGNPRPPRAAPSGPAARSRAAPSDDEEDDARRGWHAGRGATAKRGNPRRRPRRPPIPGSRG